MKNFKFVLFLFVVISFLSFLSSCTTVNPGNKGVRVSLGETDTSKVYGEGMHGGLGYFFGTSEMVEYDVREKTLVQKFEFNDKKNMLTKVEVSLDYTLDPDKVNLLHTKITDYETKLAKSIKSACKEVIPKYTAVELNLNKRQQAEMEISSIVEKELPEFYVLFKRLQMTDVDIPSSISKLAEQTAAQIEKNKLAEKKEAEKVALAKAQVAEAKGKADAQIARAKGEYEAAKFDSKTKELMSQPKFLELYRAETDRMWATKGVSRYGSNNVFGSSPNLLLTK